MQTKTVIRAAEYLPEPSTDGDLESMQLSQSEGMLISLFGATPDYSDDKFEALWQEVFDAEDEDMIAYCLKQGVDVIEHDDEPVPGWRDIAVMLKAIETGLLKLEK